jgi:hypothetical protein
MSSFCDQTEDILFIYYTQYATEPLLKTLKIKTFKIFKKIYVAIEWVLFLGSIAFL